MQRQWVGGRFVGVYGSEAGWLSPSKIHRTVWSCFVGGEGRGRDGWGRCGGGLLRGDCAVLLRAWGRGWRSMSRSLRSAPCVSRPPPSGVQGIGRIRLAGLHQGRSEICGASLGCSGAARTITLLHCVGRMQERAVVRNLQRCADTHGDATRGALAQACPVHARPFEGVSQSQFFRDLVNFWR